MPESSLFLQILHALAGGMLGLFSASLAGHFGYRSADRLPGESRAPHCVYCLRKLRWREYVPLIGWLFRPAPLLFPCPCGKQTGLWAQPLTETVGFALGVAAVAFDHGSAPVIPLCLGLGILPAIAVIDLFFGLIPDELNLALAFFGFIELATGQGNFFMGLVAAAGLLAFSLFLAILYSKWRGRDMLGLGDVKLFAAAGLWLSLPTIPWFFTIAGATGALFGALWKRGGGGKEFPFAPAICLALAGCVFYQLATQT